MEREVAARRSAQSRLVDAIEGARKAWPWGRGRRIMIANSLMRRSFPAGQRVRRGERPAGDRRTAGTAARVKCGWPMAVGSVSAGAIPKKAAWC